MDDDQQFCLRWNNHQSTLVSVFDTLLEKGIHVDCTLAAEGQTLKAHKVVLSACSPYFENVLSQQFDKHPIIILKDVKYAELRAMMDYMYRGEVNISQDQLAALLKAAESLQIKGLSDNKPSRPPSRPPQAVVAAHPPRPASPPPQPRDSSVDSREGSLSPTRRRKKARRLSTEGAPPPEPALIAGNGEEPTCKEEAPRDGVEDLTLDEEAEEQPPIAHNDVVRNFQWHLERSQDEIMNSSDSARESQDQKVPLPPCGVVTRSTKLTDEFLPSTKTFVVLKNVTTSNMDVSVPASASASAPAPVPPIVQPKVEPKAEPKAEPIVESTKENKKRPPNTSETNKSAPKKLQELFRSDDANELPCAQYRTEHGYKCPNCPRLYNARKNLVRHVTLECGREPQYKCPHCAYSKHRRNELKKHIEKKHPDKYQTRAAVVR